MQTLKIHSKNININYIYVLYRLLHYNENKIGIKIEKLFAQCELHYIESVCKWGK